MLDQLTKRFIKNPEDTHNQAVREAYATLAGWMGMAINLLLFLIKLPLGFAMGSIAVTSDAFNNLSDMGSSLISIIGARLSNKRPDGEHPLGHGRYEYIASLAVALLILLVGIELFRESLRQILNPEPLTLRVGLMVLLALSIALKIFMYAYNRGWGKRIDSGILLAAAQDSINDVIATSAVLVSLILSRWVDFPIDGLAGLLVSVFICYSGFQIARETIDLLLGKRPDPKLLAAIQAIVLSGEDVTGAHDLLVHDYGPGRLMATIHAEVPDDADIVAIHEVIDELERRVMRELSVPLVIHIDPISTRSEATNEMRDRIEEMLRGIDDRLTMHDFRMTGGSKSIKCIFDLAIPHDMNENSRKQVLAAIEGGIRALDPRCTCVIHVDENFTV